MQPNSVRFLSDSHSKRLIIIQTFKLKENKGGKLGRQMVGFQLKAIIVKYEKKIYISRVFVDTLTSSPIEDSCTFSCYDGVKRISEQKEKDIYHKI